MLMKAKEEELNSIIMELRKNTEAIKDILEKTDNDKQEALDSYTREKEAGATAERLQASLSEDLKRAQIDIACGNQKIQSLRHQLLRKILRYVCCEGKKLISLQAFCLESAVLVGL